MLVLLVFAAAVVCYAEAGWVSWPTFPCYASFISKRHTTWNLQARPCTKAGGHIEQGSRTDLRAVRPSEYSPQRPEVCALQEIIWAMAADSAGHGGDAAGHLVPTDCSDPIYW